MGCRAGPRPSITPVSLTARSLANGTVIDDTPLGAAGNVVTEGVKPAIVVVVVVVVVLATVAESEFVSGSNGTTGDGTAALLLAIVVVVA